VIWLNCLDVDKHGSDLAEFLSVDRQCASDLA
jgi:hypothetical protein